MKYKLALVVIPPKEIEREVLFFSNKYTRKQYGKISKNIRYTCQNYTTFIPAHVTIRGSAVVESRYFDAFLQKVTKVVSKYQSFSLTLNGTRSFSIKKKPFVYYWSVKPGNVLSKIEKELCSAMKKWPAPRHHSYTPHMTLVYDERAKNPLHKYAPDAMPKRNFKVKSITVLQHKIVGSRMRYFKVYRTISLR